MKQKASATLLEFVENNLDELMKIDKMKAQIELPTDNAVLAGSIDAILKIVKIQRCGCVELLRKW